EGPTTPPLSTKAEESQPATAATLQLLQTHRGEHSDKLHHCVASPLLSPSEGGKDCTAHHRNYPPTPTGHLRQEMSEESSQHTLRPHTPPSPVPTSAIQKEERTEYEEFYTSSATVTSNMEGGDAFEMGGMDVMEVGDMEMMDGGDMEMMEGGDMVVMEGGDMEMMKGGDMVAMEAEECGGDGHRLRFKGARPRQNYQVPQKRRPRVKVKDYMCFSIISIMCCNVMFLGLLALRMSMRARQRCYRGDAKGAKRYACCALTVNIVALILTIFLIVTLSIICSENYDACRRHFSQC
ncbi:hypothetical protein NFI96_024020, partial [Prochilodus magdalenae]